MANEMRDRLIKDLRVSKTEWLEKECDHETDKELVEYVADYLLDDGWTRLPCKVGQTVYIIDELDYEDEYVLDVKVKTIGQDDVGLWVGLELPLGMRISAYISPNNIGKTVFLTKEEAEQKLKEMRGVNGMANCIDCLHFEVCQYDEQERAETNLEPSYRDISKDIADGCRFFKNKADFVEVKHGEWDWYPDGVDRQELLCTNCEEPALYNEDGERMRTSYCPNCGADMRKEGADNG